MGAQPSDDSIDLDQVDERLPGLVARVNERDRSVVIRRGGRAIAAVVPVTDLDALDGDRERWEREELALHRVSRAFADVDRAEIDRQVAETIAAVRAALLRQRSGGVSSNATADGCRPRLHRGAGP